MTPLDTHRQHQAQEAYAREQAAKVERCIDTEVERMVQTAGNPYRTPECVATHRDPASREMAGLDFDAASRVIADAMVRTWPAFEQIRQQR